MKVIIVLAVIAITNGAKLEKTYLPPSNAITAGGEENFLFQNPFSGPSDSFDSPINTYQNKNTQAKFAPLGNGFSQSGNGFAPSGAQFDTVSINFDAEARPGRPQAAFERNAAILRQDNNNDGEIYSYAYETENGIYAEEKGVATNGVEAQGGFSYTGDDGQVYSIRYTADQNGFVPVGDHLPTAPPVPEEILKALEQNARDEAAGIYDDGSYNEGKYDGAENNYDNQVNYQRNNEFIANYDDTVITNSALAQSGSTYNAPNAAIAPTYGVPNAYNAPSLNSLNSGIDSYGASNPGNAPVSKSGNVGIAPTYNSPNVGSPSLISANTGIASTYGAPILPNTHNGNNAFSQRTPTYKVPSVDNNLSFNAPSIDNDPSFNSQGAYLPPSSDQRRHTKNGGRHQSI